MVFHGFSAQVEEPQSEGGTSLHVIPQRAPQAMAASRTERLLLASSVISLLASCFVWSARKQAWMDEVFTWKEASDPSLRHLYSAIQHGADGGQPLFYTTVWLWAKVFGPGVLSLRLYSCVAMCVALLVTWKAVRRYYGMWATAFGVLLLWGTSGTLLDQNAEGRFYGLYMLSVAISVEMYARLLARPVPGRLLLFCAFCSQAALVMTHVLGLIYGGMILLALILADFQSKRLRLKLYAAWASGWLALLVWLPAIRASIAAGKPHGWIPSPRLGTVLLSYLFGIWLEWLVWLQNHAGQVVFVVGRVVTGLIIVVPLVIVLRIAIRDKRGPLLPLAAALLAVPLLLYVLSHLLTPVFVPRYTLPSAIGMSIVLAAFADWVGDDRRIWIPVAVLLLITPVCSALLVRAPQANGQYIHVAQIDSMAPPNIPLVVGWQNDFSMMMRFSRDPQDRFYLLDWPTALVGERTMVLDYHLMRAYRHAGYYPGNIQDQDSFLCSHTDFLVLDSHFVKNHALEPGWFDLVIRNAPQFEWRALGTEGSSEMRRSLMAVHRKDALPFCDRK
jgi:hypothetical protein